MLTSQLKSELWKIHLQLNCWLESLPELIGIKKYAQYLAVKSSHVMSPTQPSITCDTNKFNSLFDVLMNCAHAFNK